LAGAGSLGEKIDSVLAAVDERESYSRVDVECLLALVIAAMAERPRHVAIEPYRDVRP
jgi:hypothetical protein